MQGCTVVLRQRDQGIGYLAQRVPTRVSWWFYVPPLLVGLAIRLSYALLATQPPIPPEADQYYYRGQATLLTHGYWWDVPGSVAHGSPGIPGIAHPPLFSAVLAVADELGLHGNDGQRAFLCVIGVTAVIFCGRIGARLAGRTGEVAVAWVAAVWPGMWIYNGAVLSESVTVTLVAATLLAFYRFRERTSGLRAAVVGLMVALCALTRPELLILVVVFAPLWLPATSWARRLSLSVVFIASAAVLVGPWVGRNLHDYTHTEIMSANFGSVIVGANCGPTYSGPLLGAWDATCATSLRPPLGDASVVDSYYRNVGEHYARAHLHRRPDSRGGAGRPGPRRVAHPDPGGDLERHGGGRVAPLELVAVPDHLVDLDSPRHNRGRQSPTTEHDRLAPLCIDLLYFVVSAVLYADPRFASSCQPAVAVLVGVGLASIIRAGLGRQGAHVRPVPACGLEGASAQHPGHLGENGPGR